MLVLRSTPAASMPAGFRGRLSCILKPESAPDGAVRAGGTAGEQACALGVHAHVPTRYLQDLGSGVFFSAPSFITSKRNPPEPP